MPASTPLPRLLAASLAAALLATAWLSAPPARASTSQLSVMQDDNLLLYSSARVRQQTLDRMRALGTDAVRATVLWALVGRGTRPARRGRHHRRARPRGFDPANPATYPARNWDRFDELVRDATARGIAVYFDITGPGPRWAHGRTRSRKDRRSFRPNARKFQHFVTALGTRYSGSYPDEDDGHAILPRVSVWSLWNEPNQGGWLTPQYARSRIARKRIPMSPVIYRGLYLYGHRALERTGHGADVILAGDTAPMGVNRRTIRSAMRPKRFIRELFCIGRNGRRYRGRAARARRCSVLRKFGGFPMTGWSHHPYTKDLAPTRRDHSRDSITMANVNDLPQLLDNIAGRTGYFPAGLPIWSTEFGYETKPPDPFRRTSLTKQAAYDNIGDYLAYLNPRVAAQTQFLLSDVPPNRRYRRGSRRYWFTYQSGLLFANGKPKPSVYSYAVPFVAARDAPGTVRVWGQLRFLPNGARSTVQLQYQPRKGKPLQEVGPPMAVTDPLGFFEATVAAPGPGLWRVATRFLDGDTWYSRRVRVR
jgi:hypothetical protein